MPGPGGGQAEISGSRQARSERGGPSRGRSQLGPGARPRLRPLALPRPRRRRAWAASGEPPRLRRRVPGALGQGAGAAPRSGVGGCGTAPPDAEAMELNCSEVPLYGQMTVYAKFGKNVYLPKDAEFYFIYNGSHQRHIVIAERTEDNVLQSSVPGHRLQETVTVSVCLCSEGYSPVTMGSDSVTYVDNMACRLARLLVTQADRLTASSHQTLLTPFALTAGALPALDEELVLALTHLELPLGWTVLGNSSLEVSLHRESLLHLAVRWGLAKLSQFLLCLPGGVQALALPNEEGATPLDLALHGGCSKLFEDITNFQGRRSPGFSRVQLSEDASLRYIHSSETLTLTLNHTAEHLLEADIKLFRKYFWDRAFLLKALEEQEARSEEKSDMPSSTAETEEEIKNSVSSRSSPGEENVKRVKSPVVQLNEHEDQDSLYLDRSFDVLKKSKHPPTFLAADRLSDMLNGGDEVYANCMVIDQVGDLDINYINIEGITENTCLESMDSTLGPQNSKPILPTETSASTYPPNENTEVPSHTEAQPSLMSPSSSYASSLNLSFGLHGFEKEQSHLKKRSSSLDALDADSEGEGHSERSRICYTPVSQSSSRTGIPSGDELDSFETNTEPDFNISRTESLSLSSSLQLKESLFSGVRSRSYSCSSPKISLGKTRLIRDFTVCNSAEEQRAYSLPEPPREKRIQEEEWDKYIMPAKSESEKYKVSRTFSFLMNRMTSPRNKSKTKGKDAKDKEKLSRHQFVPGTFSGTLQCLVCDKTLLGKESFQCSNCNANVHKGCKDAASPCTKKFQVKYNKNKPQTILGNSSFRDVPPPGLSLHPSSSMPVGLPTGRKEAAGQVHPLSRSVPGITLESFRRSGASLESESDGSTWKSRSQSDELFQPMGSPPSTDSFLMEDVVDSSLWSDLSSDAQGFEAESWSLVVDPSFCSRQEKDVIKRQDVIFELMQTEMHHIQTLFIMSEIFRKGMKEELQLDHSTVDKIFPCLDELLEIHRHFFYSMKERRQESCIGNDRNFVINRIGDILVQQFSEENANKMKKIYGEFCSHHKEAVSLFKELQQNKKFQNFIKLRNSNLLARRRGIPECILLVTQRITKYPVLVERILQYTKENTEEQKDLCKALCLIKDMIAAVDLKVSEYEKKQKWLEILNKIENKTYTKLKNGHVFRKQALMSKERTLLYDGLVYWKTATGRFKDILALLLTDVLLFLQEKDQKYIFAAVDQKPSVISLQKLIAREVANEERGMFLISASSAGPEMYEIHTNSKEERNTWMRRIQQAVESCPEEEGGRTSESDEERRKAEARVAKIQQCQEILSNQDQQICTYLEEKLHIYAELGELSGFEDVHLEPHLLIKPDPGEPPQAASLLAAALKEAESLQVAVKASQTSDVCQSPKEGCGEPALQDVFSSRDAPGSPTASLVTEGTGGRGCWDVDPGTQGVGTDLAVSDAGEKVEYRSFPSSSQSEIIQAIQNLTRLLYSLQAALTVQDSHIEVHRLALQQQEGLSPGPSFRGSPFQDEEKRRSLEKRREELANLHELQQQFQQDRQRWHRRCDQQQREQEAKASRLQERERECRLQEELLLSSRGQLDQQRQEYQQSLERLREGQRLVERERERMRAQKSLLRGWKHSRQRSLPAALPGGGVEVMELNQSEGLCHENSFFINEALAQMSLNTLNEPPPADIHQDATYPPSISHSDLVRTSENQVDLKMNISQPLDVSHELWIAAGSCHQIPPLHQSSKDSCKNDLDLSQTACPPPQDSNPHGPQLQTFIAEAKLNLQRVTRQDGETGDGAEETIVYL
ncbi:LOW QUALITY PROTEIN: rho guanine nucleotide exchange factor 28 [Lagenorhynchus albirostris]|uniref:LOW QUALITY PROTEIN: rho guanine nucleotide exchange factor 28 n=1 Tax=Lagenorhynchus albirostris TaxID=27610 RepID=UPI0028E64E36|nr:LOW QUALITY PROTEIN: rho guanine nucleotide exchange factor 28 [Lagenorhynchus albirostris]